MKKEDPVRERTLYWMVLSRPKTTPTWMPVPYIPRKGRCGNHFPTQAKAELCASNLARASGPVWLPKTNSWVEIEYTVARVAIPKEPKTYGKHL